MLPKVSEAIAAGKRNRLHFMFVSIQKRPRTDKEAAINGHGDASPDYVFCFGKSNASQSPILGFP
ncbi:MAG: hypothetical protein JF619_28875 [Massilia sp.]|nr:hypothetical protein [Massilia sp.]